MEKIIVLTSLTHAMQAERLLKSVGICASVAKTPATTKFGGCGYGVAVNIHRFTDALGVIGHANMQILGNADC
ncbi:MAG: DUF3343 domain-containing protein [Eubacteriales bacterium]|nr:DUF3343 domain-containing protein [Eubacteriales bacterium]MDD4476152.1 DUF3343 domain-containing protein [Eubacteriales bacterium]